MEPNKLTDTAPRKKKPARKAKASLTQIENRWEMPKPLLAILDEHKYVNRLLPRLEAEAIKLQHNEKADFACMESIMHYMTHFPDRYHHPKEDLIFERMTKISPQTVRTIVKLRNEHRKVAEQGKVLYAQILALENSRSKQKKQQLADEISFYTSELREHMRREEREVFYPSQKSLQEIDWQEIDASIAPIIDPIFGEQKSSRYLDLVQDYINEFVSVASTGSFPVKLVESAASAVEQAAFSVGGLRHLPRQLAEISADTSKAQLKQLRDLWKVRDYDGLQTLIAQLYTTRKSSWQRMLEQIRQASDSVREQLDVSANHSDLATITLHTEKELRSFQQKPYQPSGNPHISWQAGLMNLLARATIKPMMGKANMRSLTSNKRMKKPSDIVPPGTRVERVAEAAFHADWIVPEKLAASCSKTILHLPGGGFFAPASAMHRKMLGKLACRSQTRVMLVNYRLLPEHPFPAGLEDAIAAYHYLLESGVEAQDIIVSGDSAGGCIALAMLLSLRDEKLPLPAACMLLSPLTDLTFSNDARQTNRWKDPMLPTRRGTGAYEAYAGKTPGDDPSVSPIYGNFEGFPPILALVSSTETLLDDTLVVARKARAAGVDVDVEVWQNLPHDWPIFGFIPEADLAVERMAEYCEQFLEP